VDLRERCKLTQRDVGGAPSANSLYFDCGGIATECC